jgi:carbohydrate kinase (thermoresistant glucokinase family)
MVVIVCGVAAVGKTTIGRLLAQELGWKFYDADDFHPTANIEKMKAGSPLTDEDRWPWLDRLRKLIEGCLVAHDNAVVACSALKRAYRDRLRVSEEVQFVFLRASRARVSEHFQGRHGHFMPAGLLDSQFADLEEPQVDEHALVVDVEGLPLAVTRLIKTKLSLPL